MLALFSIISNQRNFKSAVSALSSTSSAFGTAAASSKFDTSNGIDEQLKAQVLAEEEAAMNQYKVSWILLSIKCPLINWLFSACSLVLVQGIVAH